MSDTRTARHAASAPAGKESPLRLAFIIIVMVILLIPLVCMTFARTDEAAGNTDLAQWPALTDEGGANVDFLSDAGSYFEDRFAFRNQLITADATLRRALFGTSATERVTVGSDGWLYYKGTMDDYTGANHLSDRQLDNIAFNLSLIQGYVEAKGGVFLYTIAPNKNSLYPENMPARILPDQEQHDAQRLASLLEEYGVNYVDLFDVLGSQDRVLYYQGDTHWNKEGAAVAADALLSAASIDHEAYGEDDFQPADQHVGDIAQILQPCWTPVETAPDYVVQPAFQWLAQGESQAQAAALSDQAQGDSISSWITTQGQGTASLLMFRDSFGNDLLAPMAEAFGEAAFSKITPYDLTLVNSLEPSVVIIERAERNISTLQVTTPVMAAPKTSGIESTGTCEGASTVEVTEDGGMYRIDGAADPAIVDADTPIYVAVETDEGVVDYIPFRMTVGQADASTAELADSSQADTDAGEENPYGFRLYLSESRVTLGSTHISVIVQSAGSLITVAQTDI